MYLSRVSQLSVPHPTNSAATLCLHSLSTPSGNRGHGSMPRLTVAGQEAEGDGAYSPDYASPIFEAVREDQ